MAIGDLFVVSLLTLVMCGAVVVVVTVVIVVPVLLNDAICRFDGAVCRDVSRDVVG